MRIVRTGVLLLTVLATLHMGAPSAAAGTPHRSPAAADATRPSLSAAVDRASPVPGESIVFSGTLSPGARRLVLVQRRVAGQWHNEAWGSTSGSGDYSLTTAAPGETGRHRYRVEAAQMGSHDAVHSAVLRLEVRPPRTGWLSSLDPVSADCCAVSRGPFTVEGETYPHSVAVGLGPRTNRASAEYHLGGAWRSFETVLGLSEASVTGAGARVVISTDGRRAFDGRVTLGRPAEVRINVDRVRRLRVEVSGAYDALGGASDAVLAGARLSTGPSTARPAEGPVVEYLEDRELVDSLCCDVEEAGVVRISGQWYPGSLAGRFSGASGSTFAEYDLAHAYQRLMGTFGVDDASAADGVAQVRVFGDGVLLGQATARLGAPAPLDIPVSGVLRLRIEFDWSSAGGRSGSAVLGAARLTR